VIPADNPVAIPRPEIDPTAGTLLDHVPEGVGSLNIAVCPTQTPARPITGEGVRFTVIGVVLIQPDDKL